MAKENKRRYRSSAMYREPQFEVIKTVGQTVPDQAMSVRTILQRYVNGMLPDLNHEAYYNDKEFGDGEDIRNLDLVEIRERRIALEQEAQALLDEDLRRQHKERDDYQKYLREKELEAKKKAILDVVKKDGKTVIEPHDPNLKDFD